ncbi:MAG: ATP-binding protein [Gemmataceae bacterium]|nr:ATP-binding protein [Gemmataceae bacterium]
MPADANGCGKTRAIVVESDEALRVRVRDFLIAELGWEAIGCPAADEAICLVEGQPPHLILAGLHAPEQRGLSLLDDLHERAPELPIVILMGEGAEHLTLQALRKGAVGFASAANLEDELPDILERVASAARSVRDRRRLQSCLTRVELEFSLENDPGMVPTLVADVQDHMALLGFGDKSARVRLGVALEESLLNAMIHGNLEISSALKQEDDALYRQTIEERRTSRPYNRRRLRFRARLLGHRAEFIVSDSGPGFDPGQLPDPTDPANLEKVSGRGLLLIRTFMDEVRFNAKGNRIRMIKRLGKRRAVSH